MRRRTLQIVAVHADGEPQRLPAWLSAVRSGALPGGFALDDGVGLLFCGQRMRRAVSSREGACAQRVDAVAGELVRRRTEPELLGSGSPIPAAADEDIRELRSVRRLRRRMSGGSSPIEAGRKQASHGRRPLASIDRGRAAGRTSSPLGQDRFDFRSELFLPLRIWMV